MARKPGQYNLRCSWVFTSAGPAVIRSATGTLVPAHEPPGREGRGAFRRGDSTGPDGRGNGIPSPVMKAKLPGLPGVVVRNSQALSRGRIPSPSYLPVNQHAPLKEFQRAVDYFPSSGSSPEPRTPMAHNWKIGRDIRRHRSTLTAQIFGDRRALRYKRQG